jgi:membrane protease YdiL (CAAX protease family)
MVASVTLAFSPATRYDASPNVSAISLLVQECLALVLLAYVLLRQGRTRADIGLTFSWKDIPRSLAIVAVSHVAFLLVFAAVSRLFPETPENVRDVAKLTQIQAASMSLLVGVALLNPFFEESIVRAYAMTELAALTGSRIVAVAGSVAVQVAYHVYQGPRNAVALGAVFLVFSLYYARAGRAVPVIIAHMYFDAIAVAFSLRA